MQVIKEDLDSIAFGSSILKIDEIDLTINFKDFEKKYIDDFNPLYVYSKVPIEELEKIHYLENNGFNFVETQFKMIKRLFKMEDMTLFHGEYELELAKESDLPLLHSLSDKILQVDRMLIDPKLNNKDAQKRYHLYIDKSYYTEDENLFKLVHIPTQSIVGFHSDKIIDSKNILFFIGGIVPEYHNTGANFALEYAVFNYFYERGFKSITTHIGAHNYKIINFEMRTVGFKPKQTYVILRKVF